MPACCVLLVLVLHKVCSRLVSLTTILIMLVQMPMRHAQESTKFHPCIVLLLKMTKKEKKSKKKSKKVISTVYILQIYSVMLYNHYPCHCSQLFITIIHVYKGYFCCHPPYCIGA
jgi:hypothetical protein